MALGQRDPSLEQQWRERVSNWHESGLSVRAFCVRNGLTEPTFHYWKRELQARDQASAKSASARPTFVPVTVLPGATFSIEVRCPSGHVVMLPTCDAASLASLFAALDSLSGSGEEPRPC